MTFRFGLVGVALFHAGIVTGQSGPANAAQPTIAQAQRSPSVYATSGPQVTVQGLPYSVTEIVTTVRPGRNGATHTYTRESRLMRDTGGRTRKESGFVRSGVYEVGEVTIGDPAARFEVLMNPREKLANVYHFVAEQYPSADEVAKIDVRDTEWRESQDAPAGTRSEVESLGAKMMAGVYAVGTRRVTIIPPGVAGNRTDGDLRVVKEEWRSPELKMSLGGTTLDPRYGLFIATAVSDLSQSEPDPALFRIPMGYGVTDYPPGQPSAQFPHNGPASVRANKGGQPH